ncbi:MAG: LD-carboxypeptidase [Candidatus Omnitrophica bacterium]|nr:LD-carboxypeptidase [Candidatus Omnitrophota bacterium]
MYKSMLKPRRLNKGDTIGIVAPAWTFEPDTFKRGIEKLKDLGYKVKYDRSIFNKYWSMAGFDRERAEQINRMFADREVKAIFCAKAGYGSMRTIPYLDSKLIQKNPKIFIGYSDITILLSYLYNTARMVVFHGPVVSDEIYEGMNNITLDYLLDAITVPKAIGELRFPHLKTIREGKATGILVGGNLSMIVNSLATPYEFETDQKILYLEDIGEDLEVLDSYLMQLKLAGKLKKIKGLVFGRMIDCIDESGEKYKMQDIINDILHDVDVPTLYGFPSGHTEEGEIDITLPFGVSVTLDADDPHLVINEAGVR